MTPDPRRQACGTGMSTIRIGLFALTLCGVAGCASSLLPTPAAPPALFVLDGDVGKGVASTPVHGTARDGLILVVNLPQAAAGFDSARLVYRRRPNELESFAHNEWVDTPARMLGPMIRQALDKTAAFDAVIDASTSASADLRLDSEIVRLEQDFATSPSRANLTLRVTLVDLKTRRVIAARQFDASEPAATDDPPGSVGAANRAVARVVGEVAVFCVEASATRREAPKGAP